MSATLNLYNTLSGRLEEFRPAGTPVTMYVCGPTVYGEPHVGNARPVVVFDVLFRLLRHFHGEVYYARNITDIDDKIIAAATAEGVTVKDLARKYEDIFHAVMQALGNLTPTYEPRATEHIEEMLAMIAELVERGNAYVAAGHVLFSVGSFADYGKLANRNTDEMLAGARVEVAPYKQKPEDFVLWKPSSAEQPGWDSPWGRGRPGWHLECSAMIRSKLGETIDIHGGGIDLTFPHHENEIAQSRCAGAIPELARYWLHNGHITMNKRKMAKSAGNFATLSEALVKHPGEVVRYALLTAHYRSPLDWGKQVLATAQTALNRLYRALSAGPVIASEVELPNEFMNALAADMNTPRALAYLHELATAANSATGAVARAYRTELLVAGNLLGLLRKDPQEWLRGSGEAGTISDEQVDELVCERVKARAQGDYATADKLRNKLQDIGVELEDATAGTTWRRR